LLLQNEFVSRRWASSSDGFDIDWASTNLVLEEKKIFRLLRKKVVYRLLLQREKVVYRPFRMKMEVYRQLLQREKVVYRPLLR
jgi:hypothetical protein